MGGDGGTVRKGSIIRHFGVRISNGSASRYRRDTRPLTDRQLTLPLLRSVAAGAAILSLQAAGRERARAWPRALLFQMLAVSQRVSEDRAAAQGAVRGRPADRRRDRDRRDPHQQDP